MHTVKVKRRLRMRSRAAVVIGSLLSLLGVSAIAATSGPAAFADTGQAKVMVTDLLRNMRDNGYNHCPGPANGMYVNWRYGTVPLQVNFTSAGTTDPSPCDRHDRLTDLRFLHNLLHYRRLFPADREFDSTIAQYTAIVKADFADGADDRGWAYFEFAQMAKLSPDPFFASTAAGLIRNWLGGQPVADRGDWAVEQAAAMIYHGRLHHDDALVRTGFSRLAIAYRTYYNAQYHMILSQGQVKSGEVGQEIEDLTWAGLPGAAHDLLNGIQSAMWDHQHGGYIFKVDFRTTPPTFDATTKETGRQAEMLDAALVAGDRWLTSTMLALVTGPIYYRPGHGVLYEQAPDWSIRTTPNGPENWVTTEAMGITANSLLAVLDRPDTRFGLTMLAAALLTGATYVTTP